MISRFQFVDDLRATFEVKRLCQVLDVNRSSYYKWLAGAGARCRPAARGPGPGREDP